MFTRLHLNNFKSFDARGHSIPLGPLALIVGTNASGKSNIRDALRFLHGIGRGYSLAEILGEKYGEGGVLQWKGIRGGVRETTYQGEKDVFKLECQVIVPVVARSTSDSPPRIRRLVMDYSIEVATDRERNLASIVAEALNIGSRPTFSTAQNVLRTHTQLGDDKRIQIRYRNPSSKKYLGPILKLRRDQPLVCQVAEHPDVTATARNPCRWLMGALESMRFLDLDPQALRRPSLPGQVVLGDKGENLSSVLQAVCEDAKRKEALVEWVQELTPLDVTDFRFPQVSLEGRIQMVLVERDGRDISAESASDGTLRFLAFAAALLGTRPAGMYFFEEIENGIHPNRVHLLLELLQEATASRRLQVIATTHSPALLNFLRDNALDDALLVHRTNGSSAVRRFTNLPMAEQDRTLAGDLLQSGWFENAAAFLNADEQEEAGQ